MLDISNQRQWETLRHKTYWLMDGDVTSLIGVGWSYRCFIHDKGAHKKVLVLCLLAYKRTLLNSNSIKLYHPVWAFHTQT